MENSEDESLRSDHNKENLKLIYDDAGDSLQFARSNVESVNTRLGLLLGFDAAFVRLSMDLPEKYSCAATFCYSCQWFKVLTLVLLIGSIAVALKGIYPAGFRALVLPTSQLYKSKGCSEDLFRISMINQRDELIQAFLNLSAEKAKNLKRALASLSFAASFAAIDLIIKSLFCF